jgi:hypothetical protein
MQPWMGSSQGGEVLVMKGAFVLNEYKLRDTGYLAGPV